MAVGFILLFIGTGATPITAQDREGSSQPTARGDWLYVGGSGPGNYTTIQNAMYAADPGDTIFVYNGTYHENVQVNKKNITLVGENRDTTVIDGGGAFSVIYVSMDGVIISGYTVQNGGFGISLDGSSNSIVIGNNVSDNNYGLYLSYSTGNVIAGNNISSSYQFGVYLYHSSGNRLLGNAIVSSSKYGMELVMSPHTLMRNNTIQNSKTNFGVMGGDPSGFYQDIDTTNTIDGKPIYYLIERSNLEFNDSMSVGYIGLVSCKNISVKDIILTHNHQGILLVNTSYSILHNLHVCNNSNGIHLFFSSNIIITDNNVSNNDCGIALISSNTNTITGNTVNTNTYDGILLYPSNNTLISGNSLRSNNNNGINMHSSSNNIITRNNVHSNSNSGLLLYTSSKNNITENNIASNNNDGIFLYSSNNNTISKNNFQKNKRHVSFERCTNAWSRNYWGRPRILPKLLFGYKTTWWIPWINIDWRPALKPYDIS